MISITEGPEYRDNATINRVLILSFYPTDFNVFLTVHHELTIH